MAAHGHLTDAELVAIERAAAVARPRIGTEEELYSEEWDRIDKGR
jgi:hypothetical protein